MVQDYSLVIFLFVGGKGVIHLAGDASYAFHCLFKSGTTGTTQIMISCSPCLRITTFVLDNY